MSKLRKSVRVYLRMIAALQSPQVRTPGGREATEYLRALYGEFGRSATRDEIERQVPGHE